MGKIKYKEKNKNGKISDGTRFTGKEKCLMKCTMVYKP